MSEVQEITEWLLKEGRFLADDSAIVAEYAIRMRKAGVPIERVNIAQRFANPLLVARGVIWTETETRAYSQTH
ncbi:MAG: hypothetical protein RDA78_01565 [Roseibium sp.]|uniref:hypothetical protein n=1 Tax=Roseibium sp. TaxID=1936156 RepID=UPI003D9C3021